MLEHEEDEPATQVANRLCECMEVANSLAAAPLWARYCEAIPAGERKKKMLDALSDFVEARALLDLPHVRGPKEMTRRAMAIAAELQQAVAAWDEGTDISPPMKARASEFLACVRDPGAVADTP
jgi:hypothetical protein